MLNLRFPGRQLSSARSSTSITLSRADRREIRATLVLTLFVVGQFALPQALMMQNVQAAEMRSLGVAPKASAGASARALAAGKAATKLAKTTMPAWYAAAQKRDEVRNSEMKRGQAMLVAQNISSVQAVASSPDMSGAQAVSGPRLLREQFIGNVRASNPLKVPNGYTSPIKLDLASDKVPTQQEVSGQGAMCGALAPAAVAEPETIAAKVDQKLREEGFDNGLNTNLPAPEVVQAQVARRQATPELLAAAVRLDEGKKKVKKARKANREFSLAMQKWNTDDFAGATAALKTYAKDKDMEDSPWLPEALIHIADYAKFSGQPNEAEDGYKKVMEITSDKKGELSYEAHQKAYERWADLYMLEGRYGEARPMLEDIVENDTHWRRRTWAQYWLMQIGARNADPRTLLGQLDCGSKALAAVMVDLDRSHDARRVAALEPKTAQGFTLADLQTIAAQNKVQMVGFRATPQQLAQMPLPAILHYSPPKTTAKGAKTQLASTSDKNRGLRSPLEQAAAPRYGHYVVARAYDAKRGVWSVLNPQDGTRSTLNAKQLAKEWSGAGLALAAPVPVVAKNTGAARSRWLALWPDQSVSKNAPTQVAIASTSQIVGATRLSMAEMRRIVGTCYAVKGMPWIGCQSQNIPVRSSCPGGNCTTSCFSPIRAKGEPMVSVDPIGQNIFIQDSPIWYSPAKGPDFSITLSYNSFDASNYNSITGNKWSFNYGSHITELPNKVTVFQPDGSQHPFYPTSEGASTFTSSRGVDDTLTKTAPFSYTLTNKGGDKVFYGIPAGTNGTVPMMLELRDRWGFSLTLQYGTIGGKIVPFTATDADGRITRMQYDDGGHLVFVQTPDDKQASFSYDANGNLIQCVDVAGQAFQYAYDDMATVTQLNTTQGPWTFARDYKAAYTNSEFYSKTTIFDPMQNVPMTVVFDNPTHGTPRYAVTDHRGKTTLYTVTSLYSGYYDGANISKISGIQTPEGSYQTISYDNQSSSTSVDPTGIQTPHSYTALSYNKAGSLTKSVTTTGYDEMGGGGDRTTDLFYANGLDVIGANVSGTSSYNGPRLSQTVIDNANYNAQHQPTSITDATGKVTNMTYTAWGAPLATSVNEGNVTHTTLYFYGTTPNTPELNRLVQVKQDNTIQATYSYDSSGRVSTSTDAAGLTTRYRYNNLDRVTQTLYPDGTGSFVDYTCCSLPGVVTDRSGRKSYYDYDQLKRVIRVQDADGQTLQFEYDGEGNRTGLLDAKGVWTRWAYDGDGRVRVKTYADGATEKWNYNGYDGRLVSSVNGRNAQTNYAYDSWSQISGIDYPNSADVSLNYDALGRTVSMTDGIGTTTWAFDGSGRAQSEDGPFDNDTVTYGYDSLSRLSGRSVQRDANSADVTNIGYDNLGRLSAVAQSNGAWGAVNGARGNTWNWTYQGDTGKPLAKDAPNGTHTDYAYETGNTLQRLIGVSNKASANGAVLSQFSYGYGSTNAPGFRDNRVAASKQYGAVAANAQTTNYGYNQTSMLTGESAPAKTADLPALSQSYAFDAMGNRTQWSDGVAKTLTNAVYNRLNQLTGTSNYNNTTPSSPVLLSTSAFGYDGDGNMTNVATTTGQTTTNGIYRYDDASRLIAIETPGQSKTEFFYDGMSRLRVSRTWVWQNGAWVPQAEKRRVYNAMDVVQERDGNNAVTASYTRTSNIGGIMARTTSTGSSFYGYDGGGNVTTLTDAAGAQVGSYTYDAWGNTVASSGVKAGENPYRFSTKEAIGGLYSYGLRFYSPGIGRWINRDPIRERGGSNVYVFVSDDPLNNVDLYGLDKWNGKDPARDPWVPSPPITDSHGTVAVGMGVGGTLTPVNGMLSWKLVYAWDRCKGRSVGFLVSVGGGLGVSPTEATGGGSVFVEGTNGRSVEDLTGGGRNTGGSANVLVGIGYDRVESGLEGKPSVTGHSGSLGLELGAPEFHHSWSETGGVWHSWGGDTGCGCP